MSNFKPGDLVISVTRLPNVLQPWLHPVYVGTVAEMPEGGPRRKYCDLTGYILVDWDFGTTYPEDPTKLIAITAEEAALSHLEKVAVFVGPEAIANYCKCDPDLRALDLRV